MKIGLTLPLIATRIKHGQWRGRYLQWTWGLPSCTAAFSSPVSGGRRATQPFSVNHELTGKSPNYHLDLKFYLPLTFQTIPRENSSYHTQTLKYCQITEEEHGTRNQEWGYRMAQGMPSCWFRSPLYPKEKSARYKEGSSVNWVLRSLFMAFHAFLPTIFQLPLCLLGCNPMVSQGTLAWSPVFPSETTHQAELTVLLFLGANFTSQIKWSYSV